MVAVPSLIERFDDMSYDMGRGVFGFCAKVQKFVRICGQSVTRGLTDFSESHRNSESWQHCESDRTYSSLISRYI